MITIGKRFIAGNSVSDTGTYNITLGYGLAGDTTVLPINERKDMTLKYMKEYPKYVNNGGERFTREELLDVLEQQEWRCPTYTRRGSAAPRAGDDNRAEKISNLNNFLQGTEFAEFVNPEAIQVANEEGFRGAKLRTNQHLYHAAVSHLISRCLL